MTTTEEQLAETEAQLRDAAARYPSAVLFAMLDVLVVVACGDNPALRNYKRLQLMRGIRERVAAILRAGAKGDR